MPKYLSTGVKLGNANTWSALQTFSAGIVSPSVIGGTGTTSTLSLQSTSGVGASGADIIFKVGNNGATTAVTVHNTGDTTFGDVHTLNNLTHGLQVRSATVTSNFNMVRDLSTLFSYTGYTPDVALDNAHPHWGTGLYSSSYDYVIWTYNGTSNTQRITLKTSGEVGIGTTSPASLFDLRAGDLTFSGANGQKYVQGYKTELTPIAAAATTTTTITIPANAILKSVGMRVTVQPPGTATMVVTATTSGTVLQQGANMSTAINTTDVGTRAYGTNYVGVAAQTITITPNAVPSDATGRVRFDIYYDEPTAPTS